MFIKEDGPTETPFTLYVMGKVHSHWKSEKELKVYMIARRQAKRKVKVK